MSAKLDGHQLCIHQKYTQSVIITSFGMVKVHELTQLWLLDELNHVGGNIFKSMEIKCKADMLR